MKWLIPIGLAIGGAVAAVVLAKRSSSPTLRAYAGSGSKHEEESDSSPDTGGDAYSSTPDPSATGGVEVPHATTAHASFSTVENLAPSYRTVTYSSPVPAPLQNPAPRTARPAPSSWTPQSPLNGVYGRRRR